MKKMVLLSMILLTLFWILTGCATRSYVRQQCWEARRESREYTREQVSIRHLPLATRHSTPANRTGGAQ